MKFQIEKYDEGRWKPLMSFDPPDGMTKARENFTHLLETKTDEPIRLIVVHAEHNGTSESAGRLLR